MPYRILSCLCISLGCVAIARPLAAQETPPTRVAVVNLAEVLSKYARVIDTKKEMQAMTAPYQKALAKLNEEAARLQKIAADPAAEADARSEAQKKLAATRKQQQDLSAEAQKALGKKNEEFLVEVYADVQAAIDRHAEANQFDLVLAYNEPPPAERLKAANITRKLNGAMVPLYIRPRIDITQAVLQSLNDAYASRK